MANFYQCNLCADTEGGVAPCVFEVPDPLGDPNPTICPVSGDEAEWFKLTSEEQGVPKNSGKKEESASPGGGVQQTHEIIELIARAKVFYHNGSIGGQEAWDLVCELAKQYHA